MSTTSRRRHLARVGARPAEPTAAEMVTTLATMLVMDRECRLAGASGALFCDESNGREYRITPATRDGLDAAVAAAEAAVADVARAYAAGIYAAHGAASD